MKKITGLLIIYGIISLLFFVGIALDVLNEKLIFQFYSDSKVWEETAIYGIDSDELTAINHNKFGPVTILQLLGPKNYWGIFLFNVTVFLISLYF